MKVVLIALASCFCWSFLVVAAKSAPPCDVALFPGDDIQAALDEAAAADQKRVICLESGDYVLDEFLRIDSSKPLTLTAAPGARPELYWDAHTGNIPTIAVNSHDGHVEISNLVFRPQSGVPDWNPNITLTAYGILSLSEGPVSILNNEFHGGSTGVRADCGYPVDKAPSSAGLKIEGNLFERIGSDAAQGFYYGVELDKCSGFSIRDNDFRVEGRGIGIDAWDRINDFQEASDTVVNVGGQIVGNSIVSDRFGLAVELLDTRTGLGQESRLQQVRIAENEIVAGGYPILVAAEADYSATVQIKGTLIQKNTINCANPSFPAVAQVSWSPYKTASITLTKLLANTIEGNCSQLVRDYYDIETIDKTIVPPGLTN